MIDFKIYEIVNFLNKETELDRTLAVSVFGQCRMEHCKRARVRNPRTSKFHEYCSLRCKNSHKNLLEERMYFNYIYIFNISIIMNCELLF